MCASRLYDVSFGLEVMRLKDKQFIEIISIHTYSMFCILFVYLQHMSNFPRIKCQRSES